MNQFIMAIATGLYAGKMKKAPGTWGSLAAFVPWFFLKDLSLTSYLVMLVCVFVLGFFVSGSAEKILDTPDAGCIVIDEILGMFITLLAAPAHPIAWLLGFALFRLFDIFKPFPVSWFDQRIHGGIGIMMDDVVAGIYALICLQVLWRTGGFLLA
ncbi:phosphatidylglycerophosphatase A [Desulforhopalus sp. IMCC35007]|uniref:phosphatidylglycerophosphatase A family protein n=1 Tax=Desulforhopalus sp. IMCC35007 TaxID=2569543 RepID=UPI0010AEB156|nr:phosphatidylglycerophosphatase A [Desulforhopalus sp. IMCC35007]TKB07592.1 phosphatidylglycerophosphatase A [Desulforhopalus sp. IMCC35007]